MSKRAYNTLLSEEVIAMIKRPEDFGFRSASDFLCAAVLTYAQTYRHPGDFEGSIVRAIAREEAKKEVAKLGNELRAHVDEYFAHRIIPAPSNEHQVNEGEDPNA